MFSVDVHCHGLQDNIVENGDNHSAVRVSVSVNLNERSITTLFTNIHRGQHDCKSLCRLSCKIGFMILPCLAVWGDIVRLSRVTEFLPR